MARRQYPAGRSKRSGDFPPEGKIRMIEGRNGARDILLTIAYPHGKSTRDIRLALEPSIVLELAAAIQCCPQKIGERAPVGKNDDGSYRYGWIDHVHLGHAIWHIDNPEMPRPCLPEGGKVIDVMTTPALTAGDLDVDAVGALIDDARAELENGLVATRQAAALALGAGTVIDAEPDATAPTFDPDNAREMVRLARTVIQKYGADAPKPSVTLATALINGAHERDRLRARVAELEDHVAAARRSATDGEQERVDTVGDLHAEQEAHTRTQRDLDQARANHFQERINAIEYVRQLAESRIEVARTRLVYDEAKRWRREPKRASSAYDFRLEAVVDAAIDAEAAEERRRAAVATNEVTP